MNWTDRSADVMRAIRSSCVAALFLAVPVACLSSARADVIPGSQKNLPGWTLLAMNEKGRGFSECIVFAPFRGIAMYMGISARRTGSIGWQSDAWSLRAGQQVPVRLFVDRMEPQALTAIAQDKTMIVAALPSNSALFGMMREGNEMVFQAPGLQYKFSLQGTQTAVTELAACVGRYTQTAQAPSPPVTPMPAQQPPTATVTGQTVNVSTGAECALLKRALVGGDPRIDGASELGAAVPADLKWPGIKQDGIVYYVGKGSYSFAFNIQNRMLPGNRVDELHRILLEQIPKCLPGTKTREEMGTHYFCAPGASKIVSVRRSSGIGGQTWSEMSLSIQAPRTLTGPMRDGC